MSKEVASAAQEQARWSPPPTTKATSRRSSSATAAKGRGSRGALHAYQPTFASCCIKAAGQNLRWHIWSQEIDESTQ
jgi:hypothetical protein